MIKIDFELIVFKIMEKKTKEVLEKAYEMGVKEVVIN